MGNKVREYRLRNGWSLDELCRQSRVSRSNLQEIETGGRSPSVAIAWRLAKAFGTGLEEIFPYDDDDDATTAEDNPADNSLPQ